MLKRAIVSWRGRRSDPAAFRRLCVETVWLEAIEIIPVTSRLQAAVC